MKQSKMLQLKYVFLVWCFLCVVWIFFKSFKTKAAIWLPQFASWHMESSGAIE